MTAAHGAITTGPVSGLACLRALTRRELVRFVRQPSRIVAAVATGLIFWVVLGSGLGRGLGESVTPGGGYALYLIPGMASLTVVFSSVFGALSLIEDRREGFLQAVLASATPRWALVGSKALAGALVALFQASFIIVAAVLAGESGLGPRVSVEGLPGAAAALFAIALGMTGVGLCGAWIVDSVQGFHGVMNALIMPMWLLSGSVFPPEASARWLAAVVSINPLSWPTGVVRACLTPGAGTTPLDWALTGAFAAAGLAAAVWVMGRR